MERLSPLSDAFLKAEDADPNASLAIGSLTIFEPPVPDFQEFLQTIEGRLPLLPRYRQRLRTVPLDIAAPMWEDDPDFDIRWHVHRATLPPPGGPEEIGTWVSDVMAERMARNRPLWEYWFCTGLPEGRWGVLSKLHHTLVDGVSGTDIYRLVLDAGPQPMPGMADDWTPRPPRSALTVLRGAIADALAKPLRDARLAGGALRSPRSLARRTAQAARGMVALTGALRPMPSTSLRGPLDGSRRFTWATVPMSDVRAVRNRLGGSLNDVALAVISGGFRRLLLSRGEAPDPHALRSLVPVSVRAPGTESIQDNQVSLMLPYLPVDIADPADRLAAVRSRIAHLQSAREPEAGGVVNLLGELGPFAPVSLGLRLAFHLPQWWIATVTTNVPGPRIPLYCLGRRAEQLIPYVPIADRVRVGVAIFSYCDHLTFGITGDYATAADIGVLAAGITDSLAELVLAAQAAQCRPAQRHPSQC